MKEKVYRSPHASQYIPTNVSLSQFILRDHPGGKPRDETVLEDDCTTRSLTRSELRRDAARHAWVVRERYGVKPGDVVAISAPNSVRVR